jgi:hypothetical protein
MVKEGWVTKISMNGRIKLFKQVSQPKPARRRKDKLRRESNDPIKTALLIFLVLVLVLASIATFTGGILVAPTNSKSSCALLAAFLGTIRMMYSVIRILLGV